MYTFRSVKDLSSVQVHICVQPTYIVVYGCMVGQTDRHTPMRTHPCAHTHARAHTHTHTYTHTRIHAHTLTRTHTHCTSQVFCIHFLPPPVWFDPYEATVAVGSNVTITCRSNQWARLVISYELPPVLATSVGTSVVYHLVHVQKAYAGVIYCIGSVGTAHHVAAFYLTVRTVCKLHDCVLLLYNG